MKQKGFKYQITLKVVLKKYKREDLEFTPVYFNLTTKTVINHKFGLAKSFQEIFHRIDNWINEGSRWTVELNDSQYITILNYIPLTGSSYIKLLAELRNLKTGLINIKNNNQKCFIWCYVRHVNPVKIHPGRISQKDKEFFDNLNYDRIKFPVDKEGFSKIETKKNILYCYKNKLYFPIYILDQKFEKSTDLLLIITENKSHYMYIKHFNIFMIHKTKNKNKKILL